MPSTEERLHALAQRLDFVAHTVNRAIDRYEDDEGLGSRTSRSLARGRFWGALQDGRAQAEAISRHLPSPNALAADIRGEAAILGQAAFAFIESCRGRAEDLESECEVSAN